MVHTRRFTAFIITVSCIFPLSYGCGAGEEDQEKGKGLLWAAVGAVVGLKDTHPWIFSMLVGFVAVGVLILGSHVVIKKVPLDDGTKSPVTFLRLIHRFFGVKGKGRPICNLILAAIIFVLAFTVSRACIGGKAPVVGPEFNGTAVTAETAETATRAGTGASSTAEVTPAPGKTPASTVTIPGPPEKEIKSAEAASVTAPAVVGKDLETARNDLWTAGFEVTVKKKPSYTVPKNTVIAQTPSGIVESGVKKVAITVSIGKFCPNCGASIEPAWTRCKSCGYEW